MIIGRNNAVQFFYNNACTSWDSNKETVEQANTRWAKRLANAEYVAWMADYTFEWAIDDIDSSDFSNEEPYYPLWYCVIRNNEDEIVGSLGAIDFGRDKEPWGNGYKRVVEAQLAYEALAIASS
jgi:hypothetical protein